MTMEETLVTGFLFLSSSGGEKLEILALASVVQEQGFL